MQIRVFSTLRDVMGGAKSVEMELSETTDVRTALAYLVARYPDLSKKLWNDEGKLAGGVQVMVNGRHVEFLQGLDTPVAPTDTLSLFPPVGGG